MKTKQIRCDKCGYEWPTKSRLLFVICPNCQRKIEIGKNLAKKELDREESNIENG